MKNIFTFILILFFLNGCLSYPSKNQTYQNLSYPKAIAVAVYSNGQLTGGWGVASGYDMDDAIEKAIRNCKSYNRNYSCVIEKENNLYVLDTNIAQFKTDNPYIPRNTNTQQIDWGQVAGVLGKDILDREKARTTPTPMKYMFDYEVISGRDKICVYRSGSNKKSITISSISICPINVN